MRRELYAALHCALMVKVENWDRLSSPLPKTSVSSSQWSGYTVSSMFLSFKLWSQHAVWLPNCEWRQYNVNSKSKCKLNLQSVNSLCRNPISRISCGVFSYIPFECTSVSPLALCIRSLTSILWRIFNFAWALISEVWFGIANLQQSCKRHFPLISLEQINWI